MLTSTAIAVADFQGYVHWLDKNTGELVARERVAKERVTNSPVAAGDTVVVLTDGGKLAAFRATPKAPATTAAPAAPPAAGPAPPAAEPAAARCRARLRSLRRGARRRPRDLLRRHRRSRHMLPVVALIGRPNVGKSTLFNAMTGTRDALVADLPGPDARSAIRLRAAHRSSLHRGRYRRPCRERGCHRKPDDRANRARDQRGGPADRAGGRPRGRHAAGSIRGAAGAPQRQAACSWRSTRPRASITTSRSPIFTSWDWASRTRSQPPTTKA